MASLPQSSLFDSYQPLGDDQFRVLELIPGEYGDRIECSLTIGYFRGPEIPSYEALSYTWGGSSEGCTILVDHVQQFPVTDNLWYALKRLRQRDRVRVLWVDAICINQSDLSERERQVGFMYELYSNATSGIIWLGESMRAHSRDLGAIGELSHLQQRQHIDRACASTQPLWFERIWTIQEAAASKELTVVFGPCEMPWKYFYDHFIVDTTGYFHLDQTKLIEEGGVDAEWLPHQRRTAIFLKFMEHTLIREQRATQPIVLSKLAALTTTFDATDPRDQVFGLLGLMLPTTACLIPVDYRNDVESTYAIATYAAIQGERSFEIWQCRIPEHTSEIPSWVVNFAAPSKTHANPMLMTIRGSKLFSVPTPHFPNAQDPVLSNDLKRLTVSGTILDRIDSCLSVRQDDLYRPLTQLPDPIVKGIWNATRSNPLQVLRKTRFDPAQDTDPPRGVVAQVAILPDPASLVACVKRGFQTWAAAFRASANMLPKGSSMELLWSYVLRQGGEVSLVSTAGGLLGYALSSVAENDIVVLLQLSGLPVVLRPVGERWTFRGFAYVHGVVDVVDDGNGTTFGIFEQWVSRPDLPQQEFELV